MDHVRELLVDFGDRCCLASDSSNRSVVADDDDFDDRCKKGEDREQQDEDLNKQLIDLDVDKDFNLFSSDATEDVDDDDNDLPSRSHPNEHSRREQQGDSVECEKQNEEDSLSDRERQQLQKWRNRFHRLDIFEQNYIPSEEEQKEIDHLAQIFSGSNNNSKKEVMVRNLVSASRVGMVLT